jgi:CrcB protein
MRNLVLVCLGGALGSGARYLAGMLALRLFGPSFPVGTLVVNLLGCFLISAILAAGAESSALSTSTRLFLTTGMMGGFTTYSAFNWELLRFAQQGAWGRACLYLFTTVIGCVLAGLLGLACARLMRI